MKRFKQADFFGQVILIIAFIVALGTWGFSTIIAGYIIVGVWQLTSMVIHFYNEWHMNRGGKRSYYFYISVSTVVLICAAFLFPSALLSFLYLLLFLAPLMAIYYTSICYNEVFHPYRRPSETIF